MTADDAWAPGLDPGELPETSPRFAQPMLAVLTEERFSREGWIYERKLDGERILAVRDGGDVHLFTRNREEADNQYPELADALQARGPDRFVVDGEVVAFEGSVTSFARLQRRIHLQDPKAVRASGVAVYFYLFDILNLDGRDTTSLPLRDRKRVLRRAFRFADPLRFTIHRNTDGVDFWHEACRKGWEGIIAKRADSTYATGKRSRDWLKFKCVASQELVIAGYTEPSGSRTHFGAIHVGYYRDGDLVYAGKVGTGFDQQTLEELGAEMQRRERHTSALADPPNDGDTHWITPDLVAQIGFTEWTRDGKLRHPRFLGLRRDKAARDVVRESPG